jgi:hypothetical protein
MLAENGFPNVRLKVQKPQARKTRGKRCGKGVGFGGRSDFFGFWAGVKSFRRCVRFNSLPSKQTF